MSETTDKTDKTDKRKRRQRRRTSPYYSGPHQFYTGNYYSPYYNPYYSYDQHIPLTTYNQQAHYVQPPPLVSYIQPPSPYTREPNQQPYITALNPNIQPSVCECVTSDRPFTLRHSIKGGVKGGNTCTPGDDRCWCIDTCNPRKNQGRGFNCGNESVGGKIPEDSVCNIGRRYPYGI